MNFEVWSQPWWFLSLPVMPVGKIILKKIKISQYEAEKRKLILSTSVECFNK